MKCEDVQQQLIDYIDNAIDAESRKNVDQHLSACDKCRHELKELQILLQLMASESELETPDEKVCHNFNTMLELEIKGMHDHNSNPEAEKSSSFTRQLLKVAASIAILAVGVLIGMQIKPRVKSPQTDQLTKLTSEVKEMKEALMFTMLNEESASQRIKAVNYAEEISNPNSNIINALIKTLNTDKNVNVRLAAAYSLQKFTNSQSVLDSLIESLARQQEPIIQVVLINILAEKKEVKAIKHMQDIISNQNTMKEVKDIAQKCIKTMM
jgi:hypothetical protein